MLFRSVLLIDNMGMLSSLYRYGSCAYIGGGFGNGIHNTLEAAVFGIPVIFGPNYQKFIEAKELIDCRGARSVAAPGELKAVLSDLLENKKEPMLIGSVASGYVQSRSGATDKIITMIFKGNS